jgi:hypothetical protein
MTSPNFTTAFTVKQTPEQAFAAINDVRAWWSGDVEGDTAQLGDEFTYRYKDLHTSKQRLVEVVPGSKVVWLVLDAHLGFTEDKTEWNGTKVIFDIARKAGKTEVRFTHQGLAPDRECFEACSSAWGFYINKSLRSLISTGKGTPNDDEA